MADGCFAPAMYAIVTAETLPAGGPDEVGFKAWNLMRMSRAGLPVPAAFVLSTGWCRALCRGSIDESDLRSVLQRGITRLEATTSLAFGAKRRPLLVAVRSGAGVSMPGMMETVLDVGLNMQTAEGLTCMTGNPRLAWDSFRRFVQGYAEVVAGLWAEPFEALVQAAIADEGVQNARELGQPRLRALTLTMLDRYHALTGSPFPSDPFEQLLRAAEAVFRSWDSPRAAAYRKLNQLSDEAGTAVTVQAMVYGNAGATSGAGVAFTRNPSTGERELYFDFQFNAQGEDVVAGRHVLADSDRLRLILPAVWKELEERSRGLEALFGDAQDFEFTIADGRLYLLQTRPAKCSPWATLRIAVDMVEEGLSTPAEALAHLEGTDIDRVERTRFAAPLPLPLATAIAAGAGVASGAIALDVEAVDRMATAGTSAIFVRSETTTADIAAMAKVDGILTAAGGRTSHAAVVARQLGKVCLVGCRALTIDLVGRRCAIGGRAFREGDFISLDGNDGSIYADRLSVTSERPERELAAISRWRDSIGGVRNEAAQTADC